MKLYPHTPPDPKISLLHVTQRKKRRRRRRKRKIEKRRKKSLRCQQQEFVDFTKVIESAKKQEKEQHDHRKHKGAPPIKSTRNRQFSATSIPCFHDSWRG